MNILNHKLICDKKFFNKIPYRKLTLNFKQPSKLRKEHVLIKYLFNKVQSYLLHCEDMVKPSNIKGSQSQKKNKKKTTTSIHRCLTKLLFLKVLQNSKESTWVGVTFIKVASIKRVHHKCFPMKCFFHQPLKSNNASA